MQMKVYVVIVAGATEPRVFATRGLMQKFVDTLDKSAAADVHEVDVEKRGYKRKS